MNDGKLNELRGQTRLWKSAAEALNDERAKLNAIIIDAMDHGNTYREIRAITGMGIMTIQQILRKAGRLPPERAPWTPGDALQNDAL